MSQFFIKILDEERGPYTSKELRMLASEGQLHPDYFVRKGYDGKWVSAQNVKGLFESGDQPMSKSAHSDAPTVLLDRPAPPPPPPKTSSTSKKLCPFCSEEIASAAIKCKHCGEFLEGSSRKPVSSLPSMSTSESKRLLDIAQSQKYVMYVIIGQVIAMLVGYAVTPQIGSILLLATLVLQLFFVFKFCIATFSRGTGVVLGFLSLIPLIGLIILLIVNSAAISKLKSNGVHVGFIGVSESALADLERGAKSK